MSEIKDPQNKIVEEPEAQVAKENRKPETLESVLTAFYQLAGQPVIVVSFLVSARGYKFVACVSQEDTEEEEPDKSKLSIPLKSRIPGIAPGILDYLG